MLLEVISPENNLYKGEVKLVQMPGEMGSFEILKNHAPMVALLEAGKVRIIDILSNTIFIPISGGVVHVRDNRITILTSTT